MNKGILCLVLLWQTLFYCQYILGQSSDSTSGIKWVAGLTWEQIRQKAKAENKYIFLDCYASWCMPCKKMEKEVFVRSVLGAFMNQKFISLRVQLDTSKSDNDFVKQWYGDAARIARKYKVFVYPTLLFFKPDGKIIYREKGFKGPSAFMEIAKTATERGRSYTDPNKEYDSFIDAYRRGKTNFKKMPAMIEKAKSFGNLQAADTWVKDYFKYLLGLDPSNWYEPINIAFVSKNLNDSKEPFFSMFYPNGKKVNGVMKNNEYSRYVVDRIINSEFVQPFLRIFFNRTTSKMILAGVEPYWDSLGQALSSKYEKAFVERGIRKAKADFYFYTQFSMLANRSALIKVNIERIGNKDLDPFGPELDLVINGTSWDIFQMSTDSTEIKLAINWMRALVTSDNVYRNAPYMPWDTYANLLYKASILFQSDYFEDALSWEKKALKDAISKDVPEDKLNEYRNVIKKMTIKEPTWN
jgi:thioredoxin-related protein